VDHSPEGGFHLGLVDGEQGQPSTTSRSTISLEIRTRRWAITRRRKGTMQITTRESPAARKKPSWS
jgi:hypothetical protein